MPYEQLSTLGGAHWTSERSTLKIDFGAKCLPMHQVAPSDADMLHLM